MNASKPLPEAPEALPSPVIDNHTHLDSTLEFSGLGITDSLDRAQQVGVVGVVDVGCDIPSSRRAVANAADPRVRAAVAIHPNDAARIWQRGGMAALEGELAQLPELAASSGVVAIGETGLDYYRTRETEAQQVQAFSFARHIELARQQELTLVIHDRQAHGDVLKVLDQAGAPLRVVMHCFSGDAGFAAECVRRGYWLSLPGTVTFSNNRALQEAAKVTPIDRILVETDAPYLTPMPQRGKPNAPYLLPHTLRFLAELLGIGLSELCQQVWANTEAAYATTWRAHA